MLARWLVLCFSAMTFVFHLSKAELGFRSVS